MDKIQRYRCTAGGGQQIGPLFKPHHDGQWVKFEDTDELRQENEVLLNEVLELNADKKSPDGLEEIACIYAKLDDADGRNHVTVGFPMSFEALPEEAQAEMLENICFALVNILRAVRGEALLTGSITKYIKE